LKKSGKSVHATILLGNLANLAITNFHGRGPWMTPIFHLISWMILF